MELLVLLAGWIVGLLVVASLMLNVVGVLLVVALYVPWFYDGSEATGRRHWPALRELVCVALGRPLQRLYGYRLIQDGPPASGTCLYAHHPHGMLSLSTALTAVPNLGVRLAVHQTFFLVPGLRELALWLGMINIGPDAVGAQLARGRSVALVPGGVREQDNDTQRPSGFLQWSYHCWQRPLVPVWCAGELNVCWVWKPAALQWLRDLCMRTPWIRYEFGTLFCPRPWWWLPPLVVVMGRPIDPRQFDSLHAFSAAYWAELERLRTAHPRISL